MDDIVRVAPVHNEPEALVMEGLLKDQEIPVLIRRTAQGDVPHLDSGGTRELLVPSNAAELATQILEDTTGTGLTN